MERILSFAQAEEKILADIHRCLESIRQIASHDVKSASEGIDALRKLRHVAYEDINQIQHEEMALRAAHSLQGAEFINQHLDWYWNPRQTGNDAEPDLRAIKNGKIIISAEVTASENPKGIIDSRMRDTLVKLSAMSGRKFYFVRTKTMEQRARTKVQKGDFPIEIKRI